MAACPQREIAAIQKHLHTPARVVEEHLKTMATGETGDPKSEARKPKTRSDALGQVFTPDAIANRMINGLGLSRSQKGAIVLDPCIGPATFPRAMAASGLQGVPVHAFDIDPDMVSTSRAWAAESGMALTISERDYLKSPLTGKFDFAVLNPPYIRQEWILNKQAYQNIFSQRYGLKIPGTSNLYVYFLVKAIADLRIGGKVACIIYDSWLSTRYGKWLQMHLASVCQSVTVETITSMPFKGHLIDATIIYAVKGPSETQLPEKGDDSLQRGYATIDTLFETKRGLRLKQANFFLSELCRTEAEGSTPFVKKIQGIRGYVVPEDHPETALLISSSNKDSRTLAAIAQRLALAKALPSENISILTWFKERPEVWAEHALPPAAPFLFNYYLRSKPRFLYNPTRAYSDNFYGLVPRNPNIPHYALLALLNSTSTAIGILDCARNQGAGLAKLQLFEFRNVRIIDAQRLPVSTLSKLSKLGRLLVDGISPIDTIEKIDLLLAKTTGFEELETHRLKARYISADRRARRKQ